MAARQAFLAVFMKFVCGSRFAYNLVYLVVDFMTERRKKIDFLSGMCHVCLRSRVILLITHRYGSNTLADIRSIGPLKAPFTLSHFKPVVF